MKTPMAMWKKIYIFMAVTIILALNVLAAVLSIRSEMPSYQRRNDPHYIEAVYTEIDREMGFRTDKTDEVIKALPAGLAEYAVTMIIPNVLLIGLAVSIYKARSFKEAGEEDKARKHRITAIVFCCAALFFILAVTGIIAFGYLPKARAAASSINCH